MLKIQICLGILLGYLLSPWAFGELSHFNLKGLDEVMAENKRNYSPILGFAALRSGWIENLYRYGDTFDRDSKGKSLAQDPLVKLIRESFNSPPNDETTFTVTHLPTQAAYYFKSSTIGKILNILLDPTPKGTFRSKARRPSLKTKLGDPKLRLELKTKLIEEIEEDLGFSDRSRQVELEAQIKELRKQKSSNNQGLKQLKEGLAQCDGDQKQVILDQISQLQKEFSLISNDLQSNEQELKQLRKGKAELSQDERSAKTRIPVWVENLLNAIADDFLPERKHVLGAPYRVLLGLFWAKAKDDRNEFLEFFKHVPTLLKNPELLNDSQAKNAFLTDHFTFADYQSWKKNLPSTENAVHELLESPSKALFLSRSCEIYENNIPPLITQGWSNVDGNRDHDYADCYESTLQNLTNMMLRESDGSNFMNVDRIVSKAKARGFDINPGFIDFYRRFKSLDNPYDQDRRDRWDSLAQHLPHVEYVNVKQDQGKTYSYNMKSTVDNLLYFFENQLFFNDPQYKRLTTKEEKLNHICDFLSDDGKRLTWRIRGSKNSSEINSINRNTKIEFSIEKKPALMMVLESSHSYPVDLSVGKADWRIPLSSVISTKAEDIRFLGASDKIDLLPWYVTPSLKDSRRYIENLKAKGGLNSLVNYLGLARPLHTIDQKLSLVQLIGEMKLRSLDYVLEPLLRSIPRNASLLTYQIFNSLAQMDSSNSYVNSLKDETFDEIQGNEYSAARAAAKYGWTALLAEILRSTYGVSLYKYGADDRSLAHIAVEMNQLPVLELLWRSKLGLLNLSDKNGMTPLHFSIAEHNTELGSFFVDHILPTALNNVNKSGDTPLHLALKENQVQLAQKLIDRLSLNQVKAEDQQGFSALHLATGNGQIEIVKSLLAKGIDSNLTTRKGRTSLSLAVRAGKSDLVKFLVEGGRADLEIPDQDGLTPLAYAVKLGNIDVAKYLLNRGANPFASDKKGVSILQLAQDPKPKDQVDLDPQLKLNMIQLIEESQKNFTRAASPQDPSK